MGAATERAIAAGEVPMLGYLEALYFLPLPLLATLLSRRAAALRPAAPQLPPALALAGHGLGTGPLRVAVLCPRP